MPKCQFLFSAVFGFRNPTQEIFSKTDGAKNQKSYNCRDNTEDREGVEDTQQGGHTYAKCGLGLARAWAWCGPPGRPPTSPLRLFIPRNGKTLSTRAEFHEKHRRCRNLKP